MSRYPCTLCKRFLQEIIQKRSLEKQSQSEGSSVCLGHVFGSVPGSQAGELKQPGNSCGALCKMQAYYQAFAGYKLIIF